MSSVVEKTSIHPNEAESDAELIPRARLAVKSFYKKHEKLVKESHGLSHVLAVVGHAEKAIACHKPALGTKAAQSIRLAALLHDVDDHKYFPEHRDHENARFILSDLDISKTIVDRVLWMIGLVSCSVNGNRIPENWLIPRWADRLEAVGSMGVVRCYRYSLEHDRPLCGSASPRATSRSDVWKWATPERFQAYQDRGGSSLDMISHYYDKLLHIAQPPKAIVRNAYLEQAAEAGARELVEVCVQHGRTGRVNEEYIRQLEVQLQAWS